LRRHNKIQFIAILQAENRIQIPIEIRQQYKLKPNQFLRGIISSKERWYKSEDFFARLSSDGRITVPWEIRRELQIKPGEMLRVQLYLEDRL